MTKKTLLALLVFGAPALFAQDLELDVKTYTSSFHLEVESVLRIDSISKDTITIERILYLEIIQGKMAPPRFLPIDFEYRDVTYSVSAMEMSSGGDLYVYSRRGKCMEAFVSIYSHVREKRKDPYSSRIWRLISDLKAN
jgi:hypothetical protein